MDLAPGETLTTDAGLALGATPGALVRTIELSVAPVAAPTGAAALPAGAEAVGGAVEIRPASRLDTPANAPLLVGLPIPAGAGRADLAMALFVPASRVDYDLRGTDDGSFAPGDGWDLIEGRVDDANDHFVAPLATVPNDGQIVMLVRHPAHASPPLGRGSEPAGPAPQAVTLGLVAHCTGFTALGRAGTATVGAGRPTPPTSGMPSTRASLASARIASICVSSTAAPSKIRSTTSSPPSMPWWPRGASSRGGSRRSG